MSYFVNFFIVFLFLLSVSKHYFFVYFQVENINNCLTFLGNLGVNVEGLSAKGECLANSLHSINVDILSTTNKYKIGNYNEHLSIYRYMNANCWNAHSEMNYIRLFAKFQVLESCKSLLTPNSTSVALYLSLYITSTNRPAWPLKSAWCNYRLVKKILPQWCPLDELFNLYYF